MAKSVATYKIIGIAKERVVEGTHIGAPSDSWLCGWAFRRKVPFVARYMPSRKGWVLLDTRKAFQMTLKNGHTLVWKGMQRGRVIYPHEDALVVAAMHLLMAQVEMQELVQ